MGGHVPWRSQGAVSGLWPGDMPFGALRHGVEAGRRADRATVQRTGVKGKLLDLHTCPSILTLTQGYVLAHEAVARGEATGVGAAVWWGGEAVRR